VSDTFEGLRPSGVYIVVGVGPDTITISSRDVIFGTRELRGALTGTPATADATLRFSSLRGVSAMIETAPIERAPEAYAKMMSGEARFRMVLLIGQ
jgi:propanol-preferring alcohol dehydrogenase